MPGIVFAVVDFINQISLANEFSSDHHRCCWQDEQDKQMPKPILCLQNLKPDAFYDSCIRQRVFAIHFSCQTLLIELV